MMNEYPIGISKNAHRSFTMFVNEIDVIDKVRNADPTLPDDLADIDKEAKEITIWACTLPLPNSMRDSQSHGWNTSESFASTAIKKTMDAGIGAVTRKIGGSGFDVASIAREVSHRIGNRQPIVNPMYWQEYKGSDPRTFNFLWDLVPSSQAEANQIMTILRKLKQYTSPKLTALELGLLSPYTFDIQIANGKINDIMKLDNLAVRSIDIDYVADGAVQFHHDGTPKHMTLQIQFAELRTTVADDYDGTGRSDLTLMNLMNKHRENVAIENDNIDSYGI